MNREEALCCEDRVTRTGQEEFFKDRAGNPVFLTGLQCHNSSVGTEMLDRAIEAVRLYGGNLLEAPVYWYAVEPEKGKYDFHMVELLLRKVEEADLYLILLWFGASKNGMHTYAPDYVKKAPEIYRRAMDADGMAVASFSACCEDTLERDRLAFVKVMEYLAQNDTTGRVIAVQVENEVGLVQTDRDYSEQSEKEYRQPVPEYLRDIRIEDDGIVERSTAPRTWKECFGRHAAEAFTAWQQARWIQRLVESGKEKLDIPFIMNVSVEVNEYEEPGHCYISGGPVARVLDIWKKTARDIALFGPDIYLQAERDYRKVCAKYAREDNPLFIPESCIHGTGAGLNMMIAAADYQAVGICCFGAESAVHEGRLLPEAEDTALSMRTISALAPLLIRGRGTGKVHAVTQAEYASWQHVLTEKYHILARFLNQEKAGNNYFGSRINLYASENRSHLERRGRCLIIEGEEGEFFAAGCGVSLEFIRRPDIQEETAYKKIGHRQAEQLDFLTIEEGHFEHGEADGRKTGNDCKWVCEYRRNGDEAYGPVYIHEGCVVRIHYRLQAGEQQ